MGDKFITQKWIFRITDEGLAKDTLAWAGIDPEQYHDVVQSLMTDTSPANTTFLNGDDEFGYVEPYRRGEGFVVDEFKRKARVKFYGAPDEALADDMDSTPLLGGQDAA